MQVEDYLEFVGPDIIRLKGHRIYLEHIVSRWLNGDTPEHIVHELPTLELEEVYGVITYYLHNRAEVDAFMERVRLRDEAMMREFDARPPDAVTLRIRAIKQQRREEEERRREEQAQVARRIEERSQERAHADQ